MNNTKTQEEKYLEDFLLHIDCLNSLKPWLDNFNIFDVLKLSRTEIRHSNMISWLLNPLESHGLGDSFLRALIRIIIRNGTYGDIEPIELMTTNLNDLVVLREWENIDIFLYTNEFAIAIENKVDSGEHDNQLEKYKKIIEERYKKQSKIYLYLTPTGITPSDSDNWEVLTYSDILETLILVFDEKKLELAEGPKQLIQDYINLLRSKIVEDPKLVEICKKIYMQYKPALDLIFENKGNLVSECTINVLKEKNLDVNESSSTNSIIVFSTEKMNSLLPNLDDKKLGSWNDGCSYHYWIGINSDEKIFGCFELGGWNISDSIKQNQALIIENAPNRKASKNEEFRYKRVFTTKKIPIDSNDLEGVKNAVSKLVDELMINENKVLNLFKSNT